ncbi:isochorismatase family protein [Paracandidimonas soli]|uniref:Nicotinamidase-related amidase n=1 Tax=Paracandidimonas soli TaxID=1917182 RepID=A0A4R3VFS0_9BURK|nr:isochorismatase family protein [Paracandidimonas soli]TCV02574.1 nicotinamidase-related amidase [Paracandidimonas soli]
MAKWDAVLSDRDREVFAASGFGKRGGYGKRPVVIVVDVNINFIGDKPEPILDSIKRWRHSCGQEGWDAVQCTKTLLDAARGKGIPVIYSTGQKPRHDGFDAGRWADKNARSDEEVANDQSNGNRIPDMIAPQPCDIVIEKLKPSAFFGTALAGFLVDLKADSVIVCGTTTSGCVRATVVDAFSYNFRVSVVEDCSFDRGQASHLVSLFDMNEKYADVVDLRDALAYIDGLPDDLFADSRLFPGSGRQGG